MPVRRSFLGQREPGQIGLFFGSVERQGFKLAASERLCEAVSPEGEACDYVPATVHCPKRDKWFCETHAEDEHWHSCALEPGDEGGEG